MSVVTDERRTFANRVEVAIVGAGACGLVAALAARDAGAEVLVLERDPLPAGSTALSSGFIPAAGTRFQREAGVTDSPEAMAADVERKNHGGADPQVVAALCRESGPTIEWLADRHGIAFVLVTGFIYPGHSVMRMHALPERTGSALVGALAAACEAAGVDIVTSARVSALVARADRRVAGVVVERPDGSSDEIGCDSLVLACSGFGGNPELVRRHLPEIADAVYFGHTGNQGDALRWGEALGAGVADLTAYQGHGSVAVPHGILITWALMMEGGIQVNANGQRFSNEQGGYSEQCLPVLRQPDGVAWDVYDERMHRLGMEFDDYRKAATLGAIRSAPSIRELALACGLPADALEHTVTEVKDYSAGRARDPHGRDFTSHPVWVPPYHAVRVTGALFHTQGGLAVDPGGRVVDAGGKALPNLFAGGGAARGVSGNAVWGYLSGNGLLSAVVLGRLAGESAAALARSQSVRNPLPIRS